MFCLYLKMSFRFYVNSPDEIEALDNGFGVPIFLKS